MSAPTQHLGILYTEDVPPAVFDSFVADATVPGLELVLESRPRSGPFAGL